MAGNQEAEVHSDFSLDINQPDAVIKEERMSSSQPACLGYDQGFSATRAAPSMLPSTLEPSLG